MYDVIVIGGGPAGMTAAMYAGRSGLKVLVIEKLFVGGQASTTFEIENYSGFEEPIPGSELMMKMESHARKFGAEFKFEDVVNVGLKTAVKKVVTQSGEYECRAIILCMGAAPKELGLLRENELRGAGVSYCATCDGAFFRGKDVAVVGGGEVALEDALFLSKHCRNVFLLHRRDAFRATRVSIDAINLKPNIIKVLDTVVEQLIGTSVIEGLKVKNVKSGELSEIKVNGLFVAIGTVPNTELLKDKLPLNKDGYVITDDRLYTGIPGIYAAGDIRDKPLKQVITAAADGAIAAYSVGVYITKL